MEQEIFDTGKNLCSVTDASFLGGYKLHLRFNDSSEADFDFSELLQKPFFKPLQDQAKFKQFGLESGTLVWNNNVDISPEYIYFKSTGKQWAN